MTRRVTIARGGEYLVCLADGVCPAGHGAYVCGRVEQAGVDPPAPQAVWPPRRCFTMLSASG